ncbi:serine/threonine-protein kinase [Catenulispora rubra]|uniref:serine/threonine-protein kinase n=1 Tax=Catenulispora rubra TaxID=280293 RepID=UPI0018924B5E|nr:serine/threonine-protein kinase [Catenulispora rubra]
MTRPLRSTDPTRIGPYELTGRIGGGGMGDVFLGRSPSGRLAAVKVVRDLLADDPRFRERFRREVAAARSVSGAYTAAVLNADPDAERPWLATAYIDGPSLLSRVADEGSLSTQETRALGAGLAEALRDIHRAGLVHRDLKPGNVLLAADGPRLIDFGIIRAEDGEGLTETGYVLGSAGYMAPEQAAGGEADAAADIYALGAVLTYAATGHGPFGNGPTPGVLLRQASGDRDISGVPEGLRDIMSRCLDTLPAARPTTDSLLELLGENDKDEKRTARTKVLLAASVNTQNAEIATTPTTLMRAEPGKGAKNAKDRKDRNSAKNTPSRRKLLYFGLAGAAVTAFGVGVAKIPHGDAKTTGAETGSTPASGLPTTVSSGSLGGPLKNPLWSHTGVYADFLALSGNTLLVQGTTLTAFDTAAGAQRWTVPTGTYAQLNDGVFPATADTAYETAAAGSELVAVTVANGRQAWSVPGPANWLTRGLVGASADTVVGWSYIDANQPDSDGLWGVDPQTHQLRWQTQIGAVDRVPYYSAGTGLVLLSQPHDSKLTAYSAKTGAQAWTAKDASPATDPAFATDITSHGTSIYWATNRLYAFDANGRALWPVGVTESDGGSFHAVIADGDTVYAASNVTFGSSVIAAYRASDGGPLWRSVWPKSYLDPSLECRLALGGGNLYIADHVTGTLVALDAKTGKTLWQFHDPAAAGANTSWQIVADDNYVFVGYGTTVHGFKAD